MMTLTRPQSLAMSEALDRANGSTPELEIERLRNLVAYYQREIERTEARVEYWMDLANNRPPQQTIERDGAIKLNGHPVGSQSDYARKHGVRPYQVCRWCRDGKLQFIRRGSKYLVFLDQDAPASKPPGRQKKGKSI